MEKYHLVPQGDQQLQNETKEHQKQITKQKENREQQEKMQKERLEQGLKNPKILKLLTICKDEIPKLSGNDLRLLADINVEKYQDRHSIDWLHDISFEANGELVTRLDKKDELAIEIPLDEEKDFVQQSDTGLNRNLWITDDDLNAGKRNSLTSVCEFKRPELIGCRILPIITCDLISLNLFKLPKSKSRHI